MRKYYHYHFLPNICGKFCVLKFCIKQWKNVFDFGYFMSIFCSKWSVFKFVCWSVLFIPRKIEWPFHNSSLNSVILYVSVIVFCLVLNVKPYKIGMVLHLYIFPNGKNCVDTPQVFHNVNHFVVPWSQLDKIGASNPEWCSWSLDFIPNAVSWNQGTYVRKHEHVFRKGRNKFWATR